MNQLPLARSQSRRGAAAGCAGCEAVANTIYATLFHDITAVWRGERKVGE